MRSVIFLGLTLPQKLWQIPSLMDSMANGKPIPTAGGIRVGNTYWVSEGHTRITTALLFYQKTGNSKPFFDLLSSFKEQTTPPLFDHGPMVEP